MKKILKICGCVLAVVLAVVLVYVIYVLATYSRLEDNLTLDVVSGAVEASVPADDTFSIVTWNVGFGAYSSDYSFFMDGGTESRAFSAQAVEDNIGYCTGLLSGLQPDFILLQEVDTDSTRSYHIDESALFSGALPGYDSVFCQNYDSAYLMYPPLHPHGRSRSGLMTFSAWTADSALRRSLPIETGLTKLLDLDRCYSITRIPLENGGTLCLYNVHLSAYSSDGSINTRQLDMLLSDMAADAAEGCHVICGGDFNMDLLGNSGAVFGVDGGTFTWARPFPAQLMPQGFRLVSSCDPDAPIPSCRNTDEPYTPGHTFVLTMDGFIVSENVAVENAAVIDCGFAASDHNPVYMEFSLS